MMHGNPNIKVKICTFMHYKMWIKLFTCPRNRYT